MKTLTIAFVVLALSGCMTNRCHVTDYECRGHAEAVGAIRAQQEAK